MNDQKQNKIKNPITISKKSKKDSSLILARINQNTPKNFILQTEDNLNVKHLLTDPSSQILNTSESNHSTSKGKIKFSKIPTIKKNSLQPYNLTKLNPKIKLDLPTSLRLNPKKRISLDIKNINTISKYAPKSNPKLSMQSKNVLNLKGTNFANVTVIKTESPQKSPTAINYKAKQRNSNSYTSFLGKSLNNSKVSKDFRSVNINSQQNEIKLFSHSQGFGNIQTPNNRNNFHSSLTSFNTDLNMSNDLEFSPEKYKRFLIDQSNLTYPNKNIFNLILKIKILLSEGNREDSSFFTKEMKFNEANNKEEFDRELRRNMLYFEIDNIITEADDLCKNIKQESIMNKYEDSSPTSQNKRVTNGLVSPELNNVKNSSDRRILIYKKIFEICGESMHEIKKALTGAGDTFNITENKTIININSNENKTIELKTNNITNKVYNNSNKQSSNNLKLNLNFNLQTLNQNPQKSDRESNQNIKRKSLKKKSTRKTTSKNAVQTINRDIDSDDYDDDSMISEGVDVKLPQRIFTVKKPKDKELNYKVYTEGNVYDDISHSLENSINDMTHNSGQENTLKMYDDDSLRRRNRKLRSKSVLNVPNVKAFELYDEDSATKTKKLTVFPFFKIFNDISINNKKDNMIEYDDSEFNKIDSIYFDSNDE